MNQDLPLPLREGVGGGGRGAPASRPRPFGSTPEALPLARGGGGSARGRRRDALGSPAGVRRHSVRWMAAPDHRPVGSGSPGSRGRQAEPRRARHDHRCRPHRRRCPRRGTGRSSRPAQRHPGAENPRRPELPHEATPSGRAARRRRAGQTGTLASLPSAAPTAIASSTAVHAPPCSLAAFGTSHAPLDAAAMHAAAQTLLGRHDFSSFRAAACQAKSPLRTLDRFDVRSDGDMIEIIAEARSFLHHQVRNMVGTLKLVGEGSWPMARVATALAARNRSAAGPTAPPDGLCLTGVRYPIDPFSDR